MDLHQVATINRAPSGARFVLYGDSRPAYAVYMCRVLILFCLLQAPLFAVTAGENSPLTLHDLRVSLDLSIDGAKVTYKATLHNPSEEAHDCLLTLPKHLVPKAQQDGYTLKVAGIARKPEQADDLQWNITFDAGQQLELTWACTLTPINLPHAHPQGIRAIRIAVGHMRGFAGLPGEVTLTVDSAGMPPELFKAREGDTEVIKQPVEAHLEDFTYEWYAETWDAKRKELLAVLKDFTPAQRTHLNRSYTVTLVHLADLYALQDKHIELADTCETLATLQQQGGRAITHCGPAAKWRKHVPWQLLRMRALTESGQEAQDAAREAKDFMRTLWAAYLLARDEPQPFDHFDRARHGNYWDYDWDRTRTLYADALELLGESEQAGIVRETE